MLISLALVLSVAHAARHSRKAAARASNGGTAKFTKVATCAPSTSGKMVLILKQWHLSPKTITKSFKEKYPQERNQTALYDALASDIQRKKVQVVVAEGCEGGEIDAGFTPSFNGWNYSDLHKLAQTKGYDKILTHVPLKLEARFDKDVRTLCGDNDELIQEGNLRLSNLRGWLGFWTRLHMTYPDDKGKMYSDAAADLLKVPRDTPAPKILSSIHDRMVEEMAAFKKSLDARNDSFVTTFKAAEFQTAAIVIGGLHAEDLKNKVQAAGLGCEVLEPPGYQREDEALIADFEKAIGSAVK